MGELRASDGQVRSVALREVAPGSYSVALDGAPPGTYHVQLVAASADGPTFATAGGGVVMPRGSKYLRRTGNDGLLDTLAQITGGRVNPPPSAVSDAT